MTPLTQLEIAVLRLHCQGLLADRIAPHLGLSRHGVYSALHRIRLKTGARNSAQLGVWAVKNGIVQVEDRSE
jgi:DNA-binding CsgD family transcriptional regulator